MPNNKIILIFAGVLLVVLACLSYLFYDSYVSVFGYHLPFGGNQKSVVTAENKNSIPAGTEIPLDKVGQNALPTTTNPQGFEVPLDAKTQASNNNDNKNQTGSDILDTSQWKTYTNKKYNYSFQYPKEYDYSSCDNTNPCRYGQVYEKDGGDLAWLNGATNSQGWPYVTIIHYDNESYTLPAKTKFFDWLQQKMGWTKDNAPKDFNASILTAKGDPKKAMRVSVPQTPQAYAREEIYFEDNGKIFQIQLMDSNKAPAQEFYNAWLKTFVLN